MTDGQETGAGRTSDEAHREIARLGYLLGDGADWVGGDPTLSFNAREAVRDWAATVGYRLVDGDEIYAWRPLGVA